MSRGALETFEAKYRGRCVNCPRPVQIGDEVAYACGGGLIHVDCGVDDASHVPKNARKPPLCTDCWLEHTGECP